MRRASRLSRLALALLALWGFVAPLAPERDRVAQTSGAGARNEVAVQRAGVARRVPVAAVAAAPVYPAGPLLAERAPARRYLLHRAWLL